MSYMLVAENVSKSFGPKVALSDFSLSIPRGCIYGLLGPNGAGKTTFIRIINQITMPDTGKVFLDNEPLNASHIQKIGYMPEERGLYKNMKVGEQCMYMARLKGLSSAEARKRSKYWFEKLGIENLWDKKLSELSKGMGQKIQFVVTVLHDPELLIFDEPFSGFDPVNANLIRDEILELKNKGKTIIFSTHRMESVEQMCDYVALINQSKKILDGSMHDVKNEFKEGKFRVKVEVNNPSAFEQFKQNHPVSYEKTEYGVTDFLVHLNENSNNEVISELAPIGKIDEFTEVIPTMNEIFINAVKTHS